MSDNPLVPITPTPFKDALATSTLTEGLEVAVTDREVRVAGAKTLGRGWDVAGQVRKPHGKPWQGEVGVRWRPKR